METIINNYSVTFKYSGSLGFGVALLDINGDWIGQVTYIPSVEYIKFGLAYAVN